MNKWWRTGIGLLSLGVASLLTINHSVAVDKESILPKYQDESSSQTQADQRSIARVCIVADPTDTPLNVRATPRGRIIGSLPDGVEVEVWERSPDGKWVYIYTRVMEGYVWENYLKC
ncbi:MAG: SH3 domain-containing protein [Arthrospira sp. SH-MAG29]|nr:SH3 domain-containing protein [Arthrospira sp. SH-MAG29]MBS0016821.1 SH3 domain-containing protein [Arthrospira sp. SH-MAG29]